MRSRFFAIAVAIVLVVSGSLITTRVMASPADEYTGTHFGAHNTPRGCENDVIPTGATPNVCHHMKTGLNSLDSNNVDVLIVVPASPVAERDARIIRQAVEMWDGGISYLAPQMGLDWMSKVNIEISTDIVSFVNGTPIYTYPIVDPEIVIIASNPVGGAGIGIDPMAEPAVIVAGQPIPPESAEWPCHGLANPFDFEGWDAVPGFDHHHRTNSGTYSAPCSETGGNVCFTITPAIDPAPENVDVFNLFDLVSHEFGHCLTLGHVGDGGECVINNVCWGNVPTNDIMSYSPDPVDLNKCVSTLDVEGFATTQSKFIDTNGDGEVTPADRLDANDPDGEPDDKYPFQTQHPRDHSYASGTGAPTDCPQPDLGIVPGPRTDWTPDPVPTSRKELTVTSPSDGASSSTGNFTVAGTVENVRLGDPDPTEPSGSASDPEGDANSDVTDLTQLAVTAATSTIEATLKVKQLPPTGKTLSSPSSYTVTINDRSFDSFVRYPAIDPAPMTWDRKGGASGNGGYLPAGSSEWDLTANTVTFHIPRDYFTAPYYVTGNSNLGNLQRVADDFVPDEDKPPVGIAAPTTTGSARVVPISAGRVGQNFGTVVFDNGEDPANTFSTEDSSAGLYPIVANGDTFALKLCGANNVTLTLDWTDPNEGGTDLDLYVKGAADSGSTSAGSNKPETVSFTGISGVLNLEVDPFLVTDPLDGTTYTLTAAVDGPACTDTDTDGDGVLDSQDLCPAVKANTPEGCPDGKINVYLDDAATPLASQDVDTGAGPANFSLPVTVPIGTHTLRVDWVYYDRVAATKSVSVTRTPPPTTTTTTAAPTTTTTTVKPKGNDIDGDGYTNSQEKKAGTNPRDPNSHP